MRKLFVGILALSAGLLLEACDSGSGGAAKIRVAVVPRGASRYWHLITAGASQAGKELGVEILIKAPEIDNDRGQQIGIVEQCVADRVNGIVLDPASDHALLQPVAKAALNKIPVVIIDSPLSDEGARDNVGFVGTDDEKAGEFAGQQLVRMLGAKGTVVLLRYMPASASPSTAHREEGFLSTIRQNLGMHVLVEDQYAGATSDEAADAADRILDKINQADGIFCPNESSTLGMLKALKKNQRVGHAKFIGFDTSPALLDALKAGDITALISQDPYKMGYEGVRVAVAAIRGQPVQIGIDTGVRLITRDDLANPEVQKFLSQ